MSKALTLEDIRRALSGVKGSTCHIDGGLVYIYHTILHDENHPIDLRYNNNNLYIQVKQGVSYFCDRMRRNLKDTEGSNCPFPRGAKCYGKGVIRCGHVYAIARVPPTM